MKIQCPKCKSVYNVDDSRIPEVSEKKAYVTCRKCSERFPISPVGEAPKTEAENRPQEILPCPHCGYVNVFTDTCIRCSATFTEEEKENFIIVLSPE